MDDLTFDPVPPGTPIKTFSKLLAEGVPHKGGLAQLASVEKAGTLFGSSEGQDEPSEPEASATPP